MLSILQVKFFGCYASADGTLIDLSDTAQYMRYGKSYLDENDAGISSSVVYGRYS